MRPHWVTRTVTNIALAALIVMPYGHPPSQGQPPQPFKDRAPRIAASSYFPVFGDFDGDRRLDQAEPHSAGAHHCIRVRFGNSLESHLEFGARPQVAGALLARDINHDNIADLIWVYHSRSEAPVVWLGDGLGHFSKADEHSASVDLRGLLIGESNPTVAGDVNNERAYLAPHPVSSELPRAPNFEAHFLKDLMIAGVNRRRDLGLFLSYLRERGPPSLTSFV